MHPKFLPPIGAVHHPLAPIGVPTAPAAGGTVLMGQPMRPPAPPDYEREQGRYRLPEIKPVFPEIKPLEFQSLEKTPQPQYYQPNILDRPLKSDSLDLSRKCYCDLVCTCGQRYR